MELERVEQLVCSTFNRKKEKKKKIAKKRIIDVYALIKGGTYHKKMNCEAHTISTHCTSKQLGNEPSFAFYKI